MKKLCLIDGVLQMLETPQNDSLYANEFIATKAMKDLDEKLVKDLICKLTYYYTYNWTIIQSDYIDVHALDLIYYKHNNIADAIHYMQKAGFTVTKNGVVIEPLKD